MEILIIGANSILAQALYTGLSKAGHTITQVYHERTDRIVDASSLLSLEELLQEEGGRKCDVVYFISSVIEYAEDNESLERIFKVNVSLLRQLSARFNEARLIHASSVSVFQETRKIINEYSSISPSSSYACSKLWAEQIVLRHPGGGVNIRISSMFGEEMNTNTFLPKIIRHALVNGKIEIFGDGSRLQNYIYVKDLVPYFVAAIHCPTGENLLAVNEHSYSNLEMADKIKQVVAGTEIVMKGEDTSAGFTYENKHTKEVLKLDLNTDFDDQLNNTIQWMRKLCS